MSYAGNYVMESHNEAAHLVLNLAPGSRNNSEAVLKWTKNHFCLAVQNTVPDEIRQIMVTAISNVIPRMEMESKRPMILQMGLEWRVELGSVYLNRCGVCSVGIDRLDCCCNGTCVCCNYLLIHQTCNGWVRSHYRC